MQKVIPQLANCALLFIIWKLYANKPADWHTWQMIMLSICCHAILSLTIFKQALSILLWLIVRDFLQATKLNCQKYYVFSNANCSSPMKTMQDQISRIRQQSFYRLGIEKKKVVLNIEQWKTKERLCEILSEFVQFLHDHAKQRRVAYLFSSNFCYTEQFSNYSSNQVYFSPVMILFLKLINLDNNWRRVSVKISSVFFFSCPNRKCTWKLLKVKIKHSSKNGRLHLTAVTNMWKKKRLHEIIENQIKKAATKCRRDKPGFKSIEWSPVLPSVFFFLANPEMKYIWFSNLR